MKKLITIIVPAYNEGVGIHLFYEELSKELIKYKNYSFEVLFINDGSTDNTKQEIIELQKKYTDACLLDLSRNHGKELALAAGFDYVSDESDAIIIMDADLQHPPHIIAKFLEKFEEGYDDIYAIRKNRDDEGFIKKKFTNLYYFILQSLSHIKVYKDVGDFRLLSKKAFAYLKSIKEKERYSKGYYSLIGFNKCAIEFEVPDRAFGDSKWNYFKLIQLAITGITSFSNAPLRLSTFLGFSISILAFSYLFFTILKTIFIGESVTGYPTLLCSILLLGGIQLIAIGILGEYVGKIFNEVKNRPLYFVNEFIKHKKNTDQ